MNTYLKQSQEHLNQLNITVNLDPYLSLKALSKYCSLSIRKPRDFLTRTVNPLPCFRLEGKILVRRSEFDAWMMQYREVGKPEIDRLVNEALAALA